MSRPPKLDEAAFRKKLRTVPANVLRKALTLYVILTDRCTPLWVRALVLAALAYLINPLDAVPDALPGLGLTDDLAVLALTLVRLSRFVNPRVALRAKRLMPEWLATRPGGDPPNPPTAERSEKTNEKGEPDHEPEEEDPDGRGGRAPFLERFRILP
jgi:uncharacterized membrane protein YkvA (DUF1232 family)